MNTPKNKGNNTPINIIIGKSEFEKKRDDSNKNRKDLEWKEVGLKNNTNSSNGQTNIQDRIPEDNLDNKSN